MPDMRRHVVTRLLVLLGAVWISYKIGAIHDGPDRHPYRGLAVIVGSAIVIGIQVVAREALERRRSRREESAGDE